MMSRNSFKYILIPLNVVLDLKILFPMPVLCANATMSKPIEVSHS